MILIIPNKTIALSAEAVEYVDCVTVDGLDSQKECPIYDIKQSDI